MFKLSYKTWLTMFFLFSPTLTFTMPTLAGTATWSGTIGSDVTLSSSTNCTQETSGRNYHIQRFYVDVTGNYNLEILSASGFPTSTGDAMFALYTPTFDPASYSTNCIAMNDDSNELLPAISDIELTAGTPYDIVVLNAWASDFSKPGGIFTGEISGPGDICFDSSCQFCLPIIADYQQVALVCL